MPRHNRFVTQLDVLDPGSDKAVLALSNGRRFNLTDPRSRLQLKYQGIEITKAEDSTLILNFSGSKSNDLGYSTISTPKGEQYRVILADGSGVWLNTASSLSFHTSSKSSLTERRIKLVGEAYFEVKNDEAKPFIVMSGNQEIKVLGTHFNISAYPDEEFIETTLVEGSIRISAALPINCFGVQAKKTVILKPSQQSALTNHSIHIKDVDTVHALAWKNGQFLFQSQPLENIMLEISRWYDVDVVYDENYLKKRVFGAVMSRSEKLSEVLSVLEAAGGIHFNIQGKKVTVTK